MADVPDIPETRPVPPLNAHGDGREAYQGQPRAQARGSKKQIVRTPGQITDFASVMGIRGKELTPRVHEALTLVMNEFDKVRWELEVSHQHEGRLQNLADMHAFLPVLNRRALYAQITRLAEHAVRTETEAALIYLEIENFGALRKEYGPSASDLVLEQIADVIVANLREIDVAGEIGGGAFVLIQSLSSLKEATEKASAITAALATNPPAVNGAAVHVDQAISVCALTPDMTPAQHIDAAAASLGNIPLGAD